MPRLKSAIILDGGGHLAFDTGSAAYASLTPQEKGFGIPLLDAANAKIDRGEIEIDENLVVTGSREVDCTTEWWGESCTLDPDDAQNAYNDLETGEGISTLCDFIPVLGEICLGVELAYEYPMKDELLSCNLNNGAVFHITWNGTPWFTCR